MLSFKKYGFRVPVKVFFGEDRIHFVNWSCFGVLKLCFAKSDCLVAKKELLLNFRTNKDLASEHKLTINVPKSLDTWRVVIHWTPDWQAGLGSQKESSV